MSDALANWSSNIILSAMGGYASSGLTSSTTMVRSLPIPWLVIKEVKFENTIGNGIETVLPPIPIPWLVCRLSAVVWHTDRNVYSWQVREW